MHQNVSANRNGEGIEVDLLVVNDGDVIAIECKSSLSIDDINGHLKRLEKLKRLLPTYANKRVMGAVTGMVIPDNVAQYAYRQGLYVIAQTGDHLAVRNDGDFQAKIWWAAQERPFFKGGGSPSYKLSEESANSPHFEKGG